MSRAAINEQVRALEHLDLEGLRSEWRTRYGAAPLVRSVELLGCMLAWRIQAEAFGGLDAATKRRLRSDTGVRTAAAIITPGAIFRREYQGIVHEVVATDDGFRWGGETYGNLSAVATAITGTRWSGPKFFGLKGKQRV